MRIYAFVLVLIVASAAILSAQNVPGQDTPETKGYYVIFNSAKDSNVELQSDPNAIERRIRHGQDSTDWYDLPVSEEAIATVLETGVAIRHELRWFNAISVTASEEQLQRVRQLEIVKEIRPVIGEFHLATAMRKPDSVTHRKLWASVRKSLELDTFVLAGLSGRGVRVAVFDAGFKDADDHPAFAVLRMRNSIKEARDFYGGKENPYFHSKHGTAVLSCIAGWYEGRPIGAAPAAEFLLARTESNLHEKIVEEDHWLAAMEWAEKNGADIISSSLGYTKPRYKYEDMDGHSTLVTRAASIASKKGILVINAAGNDGSKKFTYIGAPADGDSVLTVGASYPLFNRKMPFSSYGPASSGVMKPNVAAPGSVLAASKKGEYEIVSGTSFSTPLISGFAACLMERYPYETNMQILNRIERSGHLYPYYDYAIGYGVPNAKRALGRTDSIEAKFVFRESNDSLIFEFKPTTQSQDSSLQVGKMFYWHVLGTDGKLVGYNVSMIPNGARAFVLSTSVLKHGTLRVWYDGYLWEKLGDKARTNEDNSDASDF